MKKSLKSLMTMLTLALSFSLHAMVEENAKISELAFHRVERLVLLKKIDPSFQSKYLTLDFVRLEPQNPEEPFYKAIVSQTPDKENKVSTLTLFMDEAGKTLSHEAKLVTSTNEAATWPDKDPVTLSENALHFVEEEEAKANKEILPFYEAMNKMTISQIKLDGVQKAKVIIQSPKSTKSLIVILNMDGTFNKHTIE